MPIQPHASGVDLFAELEKLHSQSFSATWTLNQDMRSVITGIIRALALLNQRTAHCPLCSLRNSLPPIEAHNDDPAHKRAS